MIGERENVRTRTGIAFLYAFLSLLVAGSRLDKCVVRTACMSVASPAHVWKNLGEMNGTPPYSDAASYKYGGGKRKGQIIESMEGTLI